MTVSRFWRSGSQKLVCKLRVKSNLELSAGICNSLRSHILKMANKLFNVLLVCTNICFLVLVILNLPKNPLIRSVLWLLKLNYCS